MTKSNQPRHAAGRTGDALHAALVHGSGDALEEHAAPFLRVG
jgi:hypothetical protein